MDPISKAVMQAFSVFFTGLLNNIGNGLTNAITPILGLIGNTPLNLTTENPVIHGTWLTMVGVADAFLGLYVTMKLIQIMHGDATGTAHMPLERLIPRIILTVILIHASAFLGQELLIIVNALCALIQTNVQDFVRQVNGGQAFDAHQSFGLAVVLGLVFILSLVRVVFQAIKRVVLFNVLFALSGPAFLMSLDEQTSAWFQFWFRTYLVTGLEQFFQFLTFGLGFQFLISVKQTGFTGFLLAIAILNLTAEIPSLMSRIASSTGASAPGIGTVVRGAVTAATVLL